MKHIQRSLIAVVLWICLAGLPGPIQAVTPPDKSEQQVAALFEEQTNKLSGDLRRIQREIAALRADLEKPSFKDIFAGIGYIFGIFGAAAFVACRRKEQRK